MKASFLATAVGRELTPRRVYFRGLSVLLGGFISFALPLTVARAEAIEDNDQGGQVLTRGPVHEAFAGVVSYNPRPGVIVKIAPPANIEEIPPTEKPKGKGVAWIPGYWGWDDERNDFLWISGTWRLIPPGREWMAGYWRKLDGGYQWITGYWAVAGEQEATYLPPPPATLEVGANTEAPSPDYGWTPGCWIWRDGRYAWRAGYWAEGRADWVWVPEHYSWTPRGYIFVDGFWDYPVYRRGVLFAPVYYHTRDYTRRGYVYSPRIVINLSVFTDYLFVRPSYGHYYFGDYCDSRYEREGFCASISFQSGRYGYDPFYAHSRWTHRSDSGWARRVQVSYQDRREHEAARPPRVWSRDQLVHTNHGGGGLRHVPLAAPMGQLPNHKDNPQQFQPVSPSDRGFLAQRGRQVQQSRARREAVETEAVVPTDLPGGGDSGTVRVPATRSPIVARTDTPRTREVIPPAKPPLSSSEPQEPARTNTRDRSTMGTRQPELPRSGPWGRPRVEAPATPSDDEQQNRESAARAQVEENARQQANQAAAQARQAEARRNTPVQNAQDESRSSAWGARGGRPSHVSSPAVNEQAEDSRRNRESAARAQAEENSRQRASEEAERSRQADERRNEAARRAQDEARSEQRNSRPEPQPSPESPPAARESAPSQPTEERRGFGGRR